MRSVNKNLALFITLAGAAVAIGAWNPFGAEVNLHPSPLVVIAGAAIAAAGAFLLGFKVEPRKRELRIAGLVVIVAMVLLALMSVFF